MVSADRQVVHIEEIRRKLIGCIRLLETGRTPLGSAIPCLSKYSTFILDRRCLIRIKSACILHRGESPTSISFCQMLVCEGTSANNDLCD